MDDRRPERPVMAGPGAVPLVLHAAVSAFDAPGRVMARPVHRHRE